MTYQGQERRSTHECIQEETIGKLKEFVSNNKALRSSLQGIIIAIIIQIVTFGFLWGQLTTVVEKNTDYLWGDVTPTLRENTRNIDRILSKLDAIKVVAVSESK